MNGSHNSATDLVKSFLIWKGEGTENFKERAPEKIGMGTGGMGENFIDKIE